jgi:hypothetical protein
MYKLLAFEILLLDNLPQKEYARYPDQSLVFEFKCSILRHTEICHLCSNMKNMYESIILMHHWFRWLVLLLGFILMIKSINGWRTQKSWSAVEGHLLWGFNQAFMYQIALGLTLYLGISPIPKMALQNVAVSWSDPFLRFWTFLHGPTMLLSLCIFHLGRYLFKRRAPAARFKIMSLTMIVVMSLIMAAIPWRFLSYGRPFLRLILWEY